MKAVLWIIIIAVIVLIAWWVIYVYYSPSYSPASNPSVYAPAATSSPAGTSVVSTTQTQTVLATGTSAGLATYLTAPNGMTLYRYTKDTPNSGSSTCNGQCASIWPPYTVSSSAIVAGSLAGATGTIGTITRSDGSQQITYNGRPLYFYSKDKKPGDTTGQGVLGIWYVVKP